MATASPKSRRSSRCRRPTRSTPETLKEQDARLKRAAQARAAVLSGGDAAQGVHEALRAAASTVDRRERGAGASDRRPRRHGRPARGTPLTPPLFARSAASSSRSARRCWSTGATGRLKHAWLAALAEDIADLHARGADVLVVSSGAIALGRTVLGLPAGALKLEESQAAAAVGQIALARDLVGGAGPLTASPPGRSCVTLARYRGAPPLPQRPRHARPRCWSARGAGRQRERHRRDERDPLRRQRSPRRPRRHHDRRRPAGAVLRHRRALHRPAAVGPERSTSPSSSASRPRSRPWPAAPARNCRAAACAPRSRPRKIATAGGTHMIIADGRGEEPARAHRRRRPLHLVPDALEPGRGAQDLDRRLARAARRAVRRRGRGAGAALAARACCRPASAASRAAFARGDAVVIRGPDGARPRPRPRRLRRRGGRAGSSAARAARSRPCWAMPAAPRWCTGTTWRWLPSSSSQPGGTMPATGRDVRRHRACRARDAT